MKLGVSYNLFDGEELLEYNLLNLRNHVDFINVVYQTTSNYGEYYNTTALLNNLVNKKLINELVFYEPNLAFNPKKNEIIKRNLGKNNCQKNGCTHHLSLDVDEFYTVSELEFGKNAIQKNSFDTTAVQCKYYYKYPTTQISNYRLHVNFIIKIDAREYGNAPWPILVDPSRKMITKKLKVFSLNEITMHHYFMVRNNIKRKFNNKSAKTNFTIGLKKTYDYYDNYQIGEKIKFWRLGKLVERDPVIVDNYFNIMI